MSLTIDVSTETVQLIQQAAMHSKVSVQEYLRLLIEGAVQGNGGPGGQTGADLLRAWRGSGVIGAWRGRADAVDSVALADQLRRAAETRSRA